MNQSRYSNWRRTLCTMKWRYPTRCACTLLKRRSRCHSLKLLRSHRRKRRSQSRRTPLSQSYRRKKSHRRKRSSQPPLSRSHRRKRRSQQPPCRSPTGRKGMPCPCTSLGKFFALLFFSNTRRFFSPFFLINVVDL
jgi:hypothetical protein